MSIPDDAETKGPSAEVETVASGSAPLDQVDLVTRRRHPKYYLEDGTVIFQAEGDLFKLHKHFFQEHSPAFSEIFEGTAAHQQGRDGKTDDTAFVLPSTSEDFERLVSVVYPENLGDKPRGDANYWTSLLRVSTLWRIQALRDRAVAELSEIGLPPVKQIQIATTLDAQELLKDPLQILCEREDTLSDEDVERLGIEISSKVFRLREAIRGKKPGYGSGPSVCETFNLKDIYRLQVGDEERLVARTVITCPPPPPPPPPVTTSPFSVGLVSSFGSSTSTSSYSSGRRKGRR